MRDMMFCFNVPLPRKGSHLLSSSCGMFNLLDGKMIVNYCPNIHQSLNAFSVDMFCFFASTHIEYYKFTIIKTQLILILDACLYVLINIDANANKTVKLFSLIFH